MNAKEIFLRASEIDSLDERAAYVTSACDGNASLRRQVEALLAANDDPDSFLDHPAIDLRHAKTESRIRQPVVDDQAAMETPGTRIDK